MTSSTLTALIIFLLPLAYSPGPGNMFFMLNAGRFGVKAMLPALIGYHLATLIVTLIIGYSASTALLLNPEIGRVLVILSAAYLVWIGIGCTRTALNCTPASTHENPEIPTKPPGFSIGAVLLLFNPKAYAIIAAMFAAFAELNQTTIGLGFIATVFTLNNLLAFVLWALAGQALLRPLKSRSANALYAIAFFAVAVWMLVSGGVV